MRQNAYGSISHFALIATDNPCYKDNENRRGKTK